MIREKGKQCGIADKEMVKHQMEGAVETIMASKVPVEKDKIFDSGLFEDHAGDTSRRTSRWGKDKSSILLWSEMGIR